MTVRFLLYFIRPKPNQMKKLSFIIFSLVLLLSCEKNDNTCNCNDPLKDLSWLKDIQTSFTNCSCEMSIIQATYNNQTVNVTINSSETGTGSIIPNIDGSLVSWWKMEIPKRSVMPQLNYWTLTKVHTRPCSRQIWRRSMRLAGKTD